MVGYRSGIRARPCANPSQVLDQMMRSQGLREHEESNYVVYAEGDPIPQLAALLHLCLRLLLPAMCAAPDHKERYGLQIHSGRRFLGEGCVSRGSVRPVTSRDP